MLADVRAYQTFTLFDGFSDVCCTNITESPCLHNYSNLHHSFQYNKFGGITQICICPSYYFNVS